MIEAGSFKAILFAFFDFIEISFYALCKFLDEIGHLYGLDEYEWFCKFCNWCYRNEI